ncbi:TPA: hypothetical protein QDB28_004052 [Burkholderia vietnamiensis]|nr:hypothetical protein [Burkholderia vietnamiensis]
MRHTLSRVLSDHAAQMDANIQAAVEAYCTPENLAHVVKTAARQALDSAIREEVDRFFRYGAGRKAVAAAVKESILSNKTLTALDGA